MDRLRPGGILMKLKQIKPWIIIVSLLVVTCLPTMGFTTETDSGIGLTDNEKQWLAKHLSISLGIDPNFEPYEFINKEEIYSGIAADYISLIAKRLGIEMKPAQGLTWPQVMAFAKFKKLDVFPAVARTSQRNEFLLFTKPYMSFPVVIFTRTDYPQVSGLKDFFGKRVAVVKGYAVQDFFEKKRPDIQTVLVESIQKGLKLLSTGVVEAFVNDVASGTYWIQKSYLTNLKVSGAVDIQATGLSIGVRNDWPELVPIIEKAIASISEEKHTAIRQKWVDIEVEPLKEPVFWKTYLQLIGMGVMTIIILWIIFRLMFSVQKKGITLQFGTKRYRIISITSLGIGVIIVLIVTYLVLDYNKRKILDDVQSSLQTVLLTTTESLDIWVINQKDFLDQFSYNAELVRLVQNILRVPPNKKELIASTELMDIRRFFKKNQTRFGKGFFIINHDFINIGSM